MPRPYRIPGRLYKAGGRIRPVQVCPCGIIISAQSRICPVCWEKHQRANTLTIQNLILGLRCTGMQFKEIAARTNRHINSIHIHWRNLRKRIGIDDPVLVGAWAARRRLV